MLSLPWLTLTSAVQFADVRRNLMHEVFLATTEEVAKHSSVLRASRDSVTGDEMQLYGANACGEGTSFDAFSARCQRCPSLPCATAQPPSSWIASRAQPTTRYGVCGDGLAWDHVALADQPQCTLLRDDGLVAFRPSQIASDFLVQISETYCPYCKPSYASVLRHTASHPSVVVFEVDIGPKTRFDATTLAIKSFKMPASACNKPLFVVPADAARYRAITSTTYLPNVYRVDTTNAVRQAPGQWRDINPTMMPFPALWGPSNASISFDECLDEGEQRRASDMRAYYGASTCAAATITVSSARDAHLHCCGACDGDDAVLNVPSTATSGRMRIVRAPGECTDVGGIDLDANECRLAFENASVPAAATMELSSKTVGVLQTQATWDTLMPRDARKCFVEASAIAFKPFSLSSGERLCKVCDERDDALVLEVPDEVVVRHGAAALRRRVDDECDCGDAHCTMRESCSSATVLARTDDNATDPMCWRRAAPHVCPSYAPCALDVDEYECEYEFRRRFHAATDLATRLIVDGISINRTHSGDARACYFDNRAAIGYYRRPPESLAPGEVIYVCRSDAACDGALVAPPPSPPLANCSDTLHGAGGTWIGNGGYAGDCASYVAEEVAAGLGSPCDKTLQQIIDDWAPAFSFVPPPDFDTTSLFRDVCCATCND